MSWLTRLAANPTCCCLPRHGLALAVSAYEQLTEEGIKARRGQHAVMGAVPAAGSGVSGCVLPPQVTARVAVEQAPLWLGAVRWDARRGCRHEDVWGISPLKALLP